MYADRENFAKRGNYIFLKAGGGILQGRNQVGGTQISNISLDHQGGGNTMYIYYQKCLKKSSFKNVWSTSIYKIISLFLILTIYSVKQSVCQSVLSNQYNILIRKNPSEKISLVKGKNIGGNPNFQNLEWASFERGLENTSFRYGD